MDSTTDELLMLRVRDGEVEILGVLYERHRTILFNFLVRLTGSSTVSEDLVHDAPFHTVVARVSRPSVGRSIGAGGTPVPLPWRRSPDAPGRRRLQQIRAGRCLSVCALEESRSEHIFYRT